jgi:hypothetical protein
MKRWAAARLFTLEQMREHLGEVHRVVGEWAN